MPEEGGTNRPTLVRPAPDDPEKAPIENVLDIRELAVFGPDIFTNKRPLWQPAGARGVYGGAMVGMCLAAGQRTVADGFTVHSCHCYFILAGSPSLPVLFHVERVRDGRSFATRTVQARQRGRCIFTTTMSFTILGGEGGGDDRPAKTTAAAAAAAMTPKHEFPDNVVRHAVAMPTDAATGRAVRAPPPAVADLDREPDELWRTSAAPFQSLRVRTTAVVRWWHRARGRISAAGGHQAHLNALAYVSDSQFIGTISHIHRLWRYSVAARDIACLPPHRRDQVRYLHDYEGCTSNSGSDSHSHSHTGRPTQASSLDDFVAFWRDRPALGMMVSLDHSIYFHAPHRVRADEWMLSEMESPWTGDGRGVVTQRIFAADGTLLATCFQEGVVRLKKAEEKGSADEVGSVVEKAKL